MDEQHIKLLAKQCHQVILMKKKGNNEKTHFWKIQDRGYAAQLLARYTLKKQYWLLFLAPFFYMFIFFRLLGLQICTDVTWKIEQLKFMLEHAFFTNATDKYHISHELAGEFFIYIT